MSDAKEETMLFSDKNILILIPLLFFVVFIFFTMGILALIRQRRQRRKLVEKIRATDNDWVAVDQEPSTLEVSEDSNSFIVKLLNALGMKIRSEKSANNKEIKLKFLKAGMLGKNIPTVFWGIKFLLAISLPMAFLIVVIVFIKDMQFNHLLLGTAFMGLLGLALPEFWLKLKTSKRKEKLFKGFPDALDLLVVCMEAGMGLDAAIRRVGEELALGHPELSKEFNQLNLELRAGKSREVALKNLADRTDLNDVNSLVTLLVQTSRFGTSLAQALRVFADSFRTARFQRAEEAAAKLSTKLIFPLALFIFPSFFLVATGPAIIQAYRTFGQG